MDKHQPSLPNLDPYEAVQKIGEGGTGTIYLAKEKTTYTEVALKVLHAEIAELKEYVDEYFHIAGTLGESTSPHLVSIFDTGVLQNGQPFLAMEVLQGNDLGDELVKHGAISYSRVTEIAKQVCRGLELIHKSGFVHADIKPNNIFILSNREDQLRVKLLDCGAPRVTSPKAIETDQLPQSVGFGLPEYWSPEQACGEEIDCRSDIYSLGIVMYEALSGHTPFWSHSITDMVDQHIHSELTSIFQPKNTPPIPQELTEIVLRCLRKSPSERFQSALDLLAALNKVSVTKSDSSEKTLVLPPPRTTPQRPVIFEPSPLKLKIMVGFSLLIVLGVIFFDGQNLFRTLKGKVIGTAKSQQISAKQPKAMATVSKPEVSVSFSSEPQGIQVFVAKDGPLLGITPFELKFNRSHQPVSVLYKFSSREQRPIRFLPDRMVKIHVQSPSLSRQRVQVEE